MAWLAGDKALRELPSPGKSGSVFFISHDERFFIKTMRKGEMTLLLKLLPQYATHIAQYPDTLLIKYLGMHRVKPASGGNVRFLPPHPRCSLHCSSLPATHAQQMHNSRGIPPMYSVLHHHSLLLFKLSSSFQVCARGFDCYQMLSSCSCAHSSSNFNGWLVSEPSAGSVLRLMR